MKAQALLSQYLSRKESYWKKRQDQLCLEVFQKASREVPAYRRFLTTRGIPSASVKKISSFDRLPYIDKKNYFHRHKLADVVKPGVFAKFGAVMTSTSGSTGIPTYFARLQPVDWQYSVVAEFFLQNNPGPTLLIDCFGMGVWIGGLITYQAFRDAALRGHPITVITPGINKKEIFEGLRRLAPNFEHVILAGYPPFIKDIVDEAAGEKINIAKLGIRFLFAAESFTENFRDYLNSKARLKNPLTDTMNIYGSAELGAMAFETPAAILIRRLALKNPKIYHALFGDNKIPTLAQYDPNFVCFEGQKGQILITADSAAPLVRYRIGDNGGVLWLSRIKKVFKQHGIDLETAAKKNKIQLMELPFVYVFERSDFSTTLYGLQIYPQTIKQALEHKALQAYLTGKFNMRTAYDKKSNQYLEINIELKPKVKVTRKLTQLTSDSVVSLLLHHSSEFTELTKMLSLKRTKPRVVFWPYNHETHFKSGIKQKWLNR